MLLGSASSAKCIVVVMELILHVAQMAYEITKDMIIGTYDHRITAILVSMVRGRNDPDSRGDGEISFDKHRTDSVTNRF